MENVDKDFTHELRSWVDQIKKHIKEREAKELTFHINSFTIDNHEIRDGKVEEDFISFFLHLCTDTELGIITNQDNTRVKDEVRSIIKLIYILEVGFTYVMDILVEESINNPSKKSVNNIMDIIKTSYGFTYRNLISKRNALIDYSYMTFPVAEEILPSETQ